MPTGNPRRRGVLLALTASALGALFLIPYGAAVSGADRGSAVAAMLLSAAVFNSLVAFGRDRGRAFAFDSVAGWAAVWLTIATVIGNATIALSLPLIGAGMTSVVLKAQVLITPLLAGWILQERASGRLWLGGTLALAGFALPQLVAGADFDVGARYVWAMIAAWAFAGMQVVTRRVIHRIRPAGVNALRLWMSVAVMLALPAAWGGGGLDLDGRTWALAATAGVLGPGLSRLCLMSAVRYITASQTALLALVGPLFAFGFGYLFFGERPTAVELGGAVLILAGVLWAMLPRGLGRPDDDGGAPRSLPLP